MDTDAAASPAGLGQGCMYDLHFLLSHVTCAMCSPVTRFVPRSPGSIELCLYFSSFLPFPPLLIVLKESPGSLLMSFHHLTKGVAYKWLVTKTIRRFLLLLLLGRSNKKTFGWGGSSWVEHLWAFRENVCVPPIWENFLVVNFISLMLLDHSGKKVVSCNFRCVESELGPKQRIFTYSGPLEEHRKFFFIGFLPVFSGGSFVFFYSQKFWSVMGLEFLRFTQTVMKIQKWIMSFGGAWHKSLSLAANLNLTVKRVLGKLAF